MSLKRCIQCKFTRRLNQFYKTNGFEYGQICCGCIIQHKLRCAEKEKEKLKGLPLRLKYSIINHGVKFQ